MIRVTLLFIFTLITSFAHGAGNEAEPRSRRNVEVEWEKVEGATQYEVQVIRKEGKEKKPMTFKVREPKWAANIKPGLYTMQVRSFDDRGVPGTWSPPSDLQVRLPSVILVQPAKGETLKSKDENSESISLRWEPVPGAQKYQVRLWTGDGGWKTEHEVSEAKWEAKVPVGQRVQWSVTAIDNRGEPGENAAQPEPFTIHGPPLPRPKISPPLSKYVREIEWAPTQHAKTYSYQLDFQEADKKKWQKIESKKDVLQNKLNLDISRPSGRYRLKVQAYGENRDPSAVQVLEFETRGGFRDPASFERAVLRDSIDKPTNYYAIASYLITSINYTSENYDTNSKPAFSAVGGTGRIGAGYQDPESAWGGFGIVDLSGFEIDSAKFTFAAAEAHITNKLEFGQSGLLLGGFGLFYKELPMVRGTITDGFYGVGKVTTIGPHGGFTYWMPLSARYGVQLNARVYYTLMGNANSGQKAKSSISYQAGALGSYRLAPAWMGFAGYAYRKDQAYYNGSDDPQFFGAGKTNSIQLQGHYLNLILEYSF